MSMRWTLSAMALLLFCFTTEGMAAPPAPKAGKARLNANQKTLPGARNGQKAHKPRRTRKGQRTNKVKLVKGMEIIGDLERSARQIEAVATRISALKQFVPKPKRAAVKKPPRQLAHTLRNIASKLREKRTESGKLPPRYGPYLAGSLRSYAKQLDGQANVKPQDVALLKKAALTIKGL